MTNKVGVGLGVMIFNAHGQILLGKRISSHGSDTWSVPGGHIEYGESLEQCAIREVREEAGITIDHPQFMAIGTDTFEDVHKHYVSIFMKAYVPLDTMAEVCEPRKTCEWRWFDSNKLPSPLFSLFQNLLDGNFHGECFPPKKPDQS